MILRLVGFVLRHLYTTFAWAYDAVAAVVSLGHWQAWVLSALDELTGPRVLEVGHGPGHLLHALHQRGVFAVGVDASRSMGRLAKRKNPALQVVQARAQHLPLATGCFQQVVATFPPAFIFEAAALSEMRRVLAPHGRLTVLLGARIRGRSLPALGLRLLYRLTAQSVPEEREAALLRPFREAGFQAQLAWRQAPTADLLYVIAVNSNNATAGRATPAAGRLASLRTSQCAPAAPRHRGKSNAR